jgi:hypothetical protein
MLATRTTHAIRRAFRRNGGEWLKKRSGVAFLKGEPSSEKVYNVSIAEFKLEIRYGRLSAWKGMELAPELYIRNSCILLRQPPHEKNKNVDIPLGTMNLLKRSLLLYASIHPASTYALVHDDRTRAYVLSAH